MKKHLFYCLLALPLMMFTSCGSDDDGDEPKNVDETVVVKDDGTTNNGSIFSAIDDKNFFLDYIKYTVEEGHLTVSGYDKVGFKGIAKIVSKITYKGNTYEVLSIKGQPYSSDEPGAFGLCKILTSVNIPSSVTTIEDRAFMGCSSLTEVNIPNSVTTIGCTVFAGCTSLSTVTLSNNLTTIDGRTFSDCKSLTNIIIPSSVTSIGKYAFEGCTGLTSITIPSSVTTIGDGAFYCPNLTSIHCKIGTPIKLNYNIFISDIYESATLYVPKGSVGAYKSADFWKDFKNIVEE